MREGRVRRYRLVLLAAALGTAIGLGVALMHGSSAPAAQPPQLEAQVTWPAGTKRAPPVELRDQSGTTFSLAAQRARVVLVTFLDSRCTSACPIEGRVLADVLHRVSATGAVLATVSVDPWRDTRASARAFAEKAGWTGRWHWLLGTRRTLARVWAAYHIGVRRTPGDILHSSALYVVDTHGYLRAGYLFPFSAASVAGSVRALEQG
jgi:protein SCO1/2